MLTWCNLKISITWLQVSETNEVLIGTSFTSLTRNIVSHILIHYTGCLDENQSALKPLKVWKKKIMVILGPPELFKTMNQSDPTWPGLTVTLFDGLFLTNYLRLGLDIFTQSLFKSLICAIKN